jgi:hypothetical protein
MGKTGFFPDPGIRILPLDPMVGDGVGGFPAGVPLRREGSHPMKVFSWRSGFRLQKKGEFRHTDLGNRYFDVI